VPAVNAGHKDETLAVLEARKTEMTASQLTRLNRVMRQLAAR
jgi:hypothetical protein